MVPLFALPSTLRRGTIVSIIPTTKRVFNFYVHLSTTTKVASANRTYAEALTLLDSLQSNRTVVSTIANASRDVNQHAIPEMLEWTRKAGYETSDFAKRKLQCVHVAGTKGKGSVCAMVENMFMQYRLEEHIWKHGPEHKFGKVGLYTSPHLVTVRERIRIDGSPISESLFTHYFFELWDRFSNAAASSSPPHPNPQSSETKPGYFRFLTLLAFHTFMEEGVKNAVIECGIGGEYDSTNILPSKSVLVTAITRLGIDHTGMLGETIEEIAWHKAGIMKRDVPAFTVPQAAEAQAVLVQRAREKGVELEVVARRPDVENGSIELGLSGDFQKDNASLAIAVAGSFLRSLGISAPREPHKETAEQIPKNFLEGLKTVKLQGRCEVRDEGRIRWLIDGAHTEDSIKETARWYSSQLREAMDSSKPPTATMLIFNQQDRDVSTLIVALFGKLRAYVSPNTTFKFLPSVFRYAAFCTNTAFKSEVGKDVDLSQQERAAAIYKKADGNSLYMCYGSVEEAVELARKVSEGDERLLVLVTGSLHLVGGLIRVLDRDRRDIAALD